MPTWNQISPEQAARFEAALPAGVERRSMFGCPVGVVNGHMFTGVHNDEINVRLEPTDRARFLADYEGARIFSPMKGTEMKEYVVVPPLVAGKPALLAAWLRKGLEYASSLPPKKARKAAAKKGSAKNGLAKKSPAAKSGASKAAARAPAKRTAAKRTAPKRGAAKRTAAKSAPAGKSPAKKARRKSA